MKRPRLESDSTSDALTNREESVALTDGVQITGVPDLHPECAGKEQGKEEAPGPGDQPQDVPSPPGGATHTKEIEKIIITSIRATDVALGLGRVPAGFYAVVHHSGLEWRTENKCSSVSHDVVQWDGPIPIPSDPSATVCLEVYASFELQPTLGVGEQLRELTITVEELLDCSAKDVPFTLLPMDGDVVSPCSSILVTAKHRRRGSRDSPASKVLAPHCSTTECLNELEGATNQGHRALSHYRKHGKKQDLARSIEQFELALSVCPLDHPCIAAARSNLAMAKFILCQAEGTNASLNVPLGLYHTALTACPVGHLDRPATLLQLAAVHFARFGKEREEVERARTVALLDEAIELSTTDSHENRAATFVLQLHASHRTDPVRSHGQSLAEQDPAVGSTDGDPCISSVQLLHRFEQFGDLIDLQQAITVLEELVRCISIWDCRFTAVRGNLGKALLYRFNRIGELSDLEDAISLQRDAVELTPHGHPDKPARLNNLGNSFLTRFQRVGEPSDLEDAISLQRDAVELTPYGHPDKLRHLSNLGSSFLIRFERVGELSDLGDAISTQRDAVELTPHGHPDKPACLNNLGNSFLTRFQRVGELSDLEDAISLLRMLARLNNLGNSFRARFDRLGVRSDVEQAILLYSYAATAPTGLIGVRFGASHEWISCARHIHHDTLFDAYRYNELTRGADVVRDAAAAALELGFPETAVEWLEQGRSIVWGELSQLRNSYEELSSAHPDLARRLQELSAALEHAGTAREKSLSTVLELSAALEYASTAHNKFPSALSEPAQCSADHAVRSLKVEADSHRALAIERDKLLHQIRGFPGFERFLLHKEFSQLRASAHSGPVVILNAAKSRCDALIVLADVDHAIHVPLPNFTFERSTFLENMLQKLLGHSRDIHPDERKGKLVASPHKVYSWNAETQGGDSWEFLLSDLWKGVVRPVLDTLAFKTPGDPSRIFWCPTGPFMFLPIHGAGFYDTQHVQPGHKVSDFVVSSYIPTLSILMLPPHSSTPPSSHLRLLTVRQPPSDGLSHLPGVATELTHIREVIAGSPSAHITLVESPESTVEEVLELMKEADWVHFACHGIQDAVNPTNSGLCLADRRRLNLGDIIAVSRPHGGLAFLSACQTAMGDEHLSDEAIHITAGMLFAGYGGVIGTMWKINDDIAPDVARDVYGQLFRKGTRSDYREAARALHEAIGRVRHSNASFVEWLPFIYVGL
ncbi:CHAT domain-containing protein [Boletus coccyginus]|nr:CHAT domain-containing protein [Boletus coccyginus]